ncbi:MAG: hypothetical protein WCW31_05395 [Patescibacteria group bacterium]|jgi:hypothetical protein
MLDQQGNIVSLKAGNVIYYDPTVRAIVILAGMESSQPYLRWKDTTPNTRRPVSFITTPNAFPEFVSVLAETHGLTIRPCKYRNFMAFLFVPPS